MNVAAPVPVRDVRLFPRFASSSRPAVAGRCREDTRGMDRERAETYLRLLAEAELRRAKPQSTR
jgi:hypothetical protein